MLRRSSRKRKKCVSITNYVDESDDEEKQVNSSNDEGPYEATKKKEKKLKKVDKLVLLNNNGKAKAGSKRKTIKKKMSRKMIKTRTINDSAVDEDYNEEGDDENDVNDEDEQQLGLVETEKGKGKECDDENIDDQDEDWTPEKTNTHREEDTFDGINNTNMSKKRKRNKNRYGPAKDRTCPFCKKVFSIITGLAYHIEHKVCQRITNQNNTSQINSSSSDPNLSKTPFPQLKPGGKFVTQYGIVEILSDSRAPPDLGSTPLPKDIKSEARKQLREKSRIAKARLKVAAFVAQKQRRRRNRLMRLNEEGRGVCENREGALVDGNDQGLEERIASEVWKEYCTLTTPRNILAGLWSGRCRTDPNELSSQTGDISASTAGVNFGMRKNLLEPGDSYPDRIVECVLVPDIRRKVHNVENDTEERISQVEVATKIVEKARNEVRKKVNLNDIDDIGGFQTPKSGTKIYLQRRLLTNVYNPILPIYICMLCGQVFNSRVGLKGHVSESVCKKRKEQMIQGRLKRLQDVENASKNENIKADKLNPTTTRMMKEIYTVTKQKVNPPKGAKRKKKRKKGKKFPAWIVFYPNLSSIYPEVFEYAKFKRGSNNNRFMQKKWEDNGGRKRVRKSRAKSLMNDSGAGSAVNVLEDVKNQSMYPQVLSILFTGRSNTSVSINRLNHFDRSMKREHNYDAVGKGEVSTVSPETVRDKKLLKGCGVETKQSAQAVLPVVKKKREKRISIANPKPPISQTAVVDIRPLVEEIRAGRYPSMTPYEGDHPEVCFLCKEGGNLHYCEFCSNSEHLKCVQSKINLKDLECDDDFMCHRCIQAVMSRRARAEKRRLRKRDESFGGNTAMGMEDSVATSFPSTTLKMASSVTHEVIWNQSEFDSHKVAYCKCPDGGPGGLICCRDCSNSYSRFLQSTSKEMEGQTVSTIGQEVSELMELLLDAQVRLKQSVDVSDANDVRRSLLDKEEVESLSRRTKSDSHRTLGGIMDIFC